MLAKAVTAARFSSLATDAKTQLFETSKSLEEEGLVAVVVGNVV